MQKNQATVVTERAKIVAPEIEIRGTVRGALGDPAAELRLPSIFQWPENVEVGGLAGYVRLHPNLPSAGADDLYKSPALRGAFSFYLRSPEPGPIGVNVDPLGEPLGARVFPEALPTVPGLGIGPEGLGLLNVGIWFVEPTD